MKKPPLSSLTPEEYETRLKKILLAALGKCWMYWPPRAEAKRRCQDPNRKGWFICEKCKQSREKIEVDHIIPCITPKDGFKSWDTYINARFVVSANALQGLCHDCHQEKNKQENQERKMRRLKNV